jgi:hypothetical protein
VYIAGEQFDLPSLKAVFTDDTAAIDAADVARGASQKAVLKEHATDTRAAKVFSGLRSMLLQRFGAEAVDVLLDFDTKAPESNAIRTVSTKAVAVAKAKATRAARGTKGPVARLDVVGTVDEAAIKSAIDSPATSHAASPAPAAPAAQTEPAAAAPAAPAPAKPGAPL